MASLRSKKKINWELIIATWASKDSPHVAAGRPSMWHDAMKRKCFISFAAKKLYGTWCYEFAPTSGQTSGPSRQTNGGLLVILLERKGRHHVSKVGKTAFKLSDPMAPRSVRKSWPSVSAFLHGMGGPALILVWKNWLKCELKAGSQLWNMKVSFLDLRGQLFAWIQKGPFEVHFRMCPPFIATWSNWTVCVKPQRAISLTPRFDSYQDFCWVSNSVWVFL